jgi:signal transduction histidine kinase
MPRRVPRSRDRVIAGVAGGWGERWRVEPTVLRAAIAVLTLVGGLGVALYGAAALATTDPASSGNHARGRGERPARIRRREVSIGLATAAALVAARASGVWPGDGVMLPAAAVAAGAAVTWSSQGGPDRDGALPRWLTLAFQAVAGAALVLAGVYALASRTGGLANVGASVSAIAVVLGGIAMFASPALGKVLRQLDDERSMRIREDERAVLAAHLHDSVLQSLVLIQRSDDTRRMVSLARRQERDLRAWLYGDPAAGDADSLHAAIAAMTNEVEADHDVRLEAVVVGDRPLDDHARAVVAAVREAVVNAARHADVDRVDVFVEVAHGELTAFVRDLGVGFDPDAVPADRRGISDSIVGRVVRAGGGAVVASRPGSGTEIEIRLPLPLDRATGGGQR